MFKLVIGANDGKAWKLETESEYLIGKHVGDTLEGKEVKAELAGYQFLVTGGSDHAGFPLSPAVEGIGLKRVLLTKGWGMRDTHQGIRRRKTVRGKQIAASTVQINLKVVKEGATKLAVVFAEQNKAPEAKPAVAPVAAPVA